MSNASTQVQDTYNQQYHSENNEWRQLGGQQKAKNILDLCSRFKSAKTIDIGSGNGAVIAIQERQLKSLKSVQKFDGYKIPFDNKSFELSLCSHVIEHVEHPRLLLREIARVANYHYFEVPIDFSFYVDQKIQHYLDYGHINIYTPALFKFLLKSEGFEVIDERFLFTNHAQIDFQFKHQPLKRLTQKLKNLIVSLSPYKKIKPNAYAVLCQHNGKGLSIF